MVAITQVSRQAGIGLLEIMLALVVAAIVLLMSVRYYATTSLDQKISSSVNIVRDISSALQTLAKQRNFKLGTNDDIDDLIDSNLLTKQYVKNAFNGLNESTTSTAGSIPIAIITLNNVPELACKRIAGRLQQTMSDPGADYTCSGSDVECVGCSDDAMTVHYALF